MGKRKKDRGCGGFMVASRRRKRKVTRAGGLDRGRVAREVPEMTGCWMKEKGREW